MPPVQILHWCKVGVLQICQSGGMEKWDELPEVQYQQRRFSLPKRSLGNSLAIQPIWGWRIWVSLIPSLCLFGSQELRLVMCWLNKVSSVFRLQETVLWSFWSHDLCALSGWCCCELPAASKWFLEKSGIKKNAWWVLCLQLRMYYFPMKIKSMEI